MVVDMLKVHIDRSDDEALGKIFDSIFSDDRAGSNIKQIHKVTHWRKLGRIFVRGYQGVNLHPTLLFSSS